MRKLQDVPSATLEGDVLVLSGSIGIAEVVRLYQQTLKAQAAPVKSVDCRGVQNADSACLAMLLYVQSVNAAPLKLIGLSDDLKVLVDLYGLNQVFEIPPSTSG
ncbi:MAG: STAS domain-containing protein [Hydrogenovibrio sp.]